MDIELLQSVDKEMIKLVDKWKEVKGEKGNKRPSNEIWKGRAGS